MALWLLEAKAFPDDDRVADAREARFYLKPGTYSVGRAAGSSDLDVIDDKSISRKHAEVIVPSLADYLVDDLWHGAPYVLVKDCSRYGTQAAASNQLDGHDIIESRVYDKWYIKFGYKSPFRLYLLDYRLFFLPTPPGAITLQSLEAAKETAAAAGLRVASSLTEPNTLAVSLTAQQEVTPGVLLALLQGRPAVTVAWVMRWAERRVWKNERPEEGQFSVQLAADLLQGPDGGTRARTAGSWEELAAELAALKESGFLAGRSFYWPDGHWDDALASVIELLGGHNHKCRAPAKGGTAAAAVVVRPSPDAADGAKLSHLEWTTPELLVAGVVGGSLEGAIQPGEAATPGSTGGKGGRKRKGPASTAKATCSTAGRRRTRAQAEAQDWSDTDVTADSAPPKARQRVLPPEEAETPRFPSQLPAPSQQLRDQGLKPAPAATTAMVAGAAGPAASPKLGAGGRKRKVPAGEVAEQQQPAQEEPGDSQGRQREQAQGEVEKSAGEAAQEAPAAKRRRGGKAAAAALAAAAPAANTKQEAARSGGEVDQPGNHHSDVQGAAAIPKPAAIRPVQPPIDGWHMKAAKSEASPPSQKPTERKRPKPPAPAAAAVAIPAPAPAGALLGAAAALARGGRKGGKAAGGAGAAGTEAEDFGVVQRQEGEVPAAAGDGEELEEPEECTFYEPLIVSGLDAAAIPGRPSETSHAAVTGAHNFKAFRKVGTAAAPTAAPVIGFDPEPYQEGRIDADAFLKAERERRKHSSTADELFAANIKARKAAPLPSVDDEAPAAAAVAGKGGRDRGRGGKAAAAGAGTQQSMLAFVGAAPARGRGRGRGRGK